MAAEWGDHPSAVGQWARMGRQQTVFDRKVVSCQAAAIGVKQHPSRRRLAQATSKKTNPPRGAMPSNHLRTSIAPVRIKALPTTRGAIQCQEDFCRDPSRRCSRQPLRPTRRLCAPSQGPNIGGFRDLVGHLASRRARREPAIRRARLALRWLRPAQEDRRRIADELAPLAQRRDPPEHSSVPG